MLSDYFVSCHQGLFYGFMHEPTTIRLIEADAIPRALLLALCASSVRSVRILRILSFEPDGRTVADSPVRVRPRTGLEELSHPNKTWLSPIFGLRKRGRCSSRPYLRDSP